MINWIQPSDCYILFKKLQANKNNSRLRFGKISINVSDIAGQFYCEKQIEMRYTYGVKINPKMKLGLKSHKKLTSDSIKLPLNELFKIIHSGKSVFVLEMLMLAKYNDVILIGKPDSIYFKNNQPLLVFEYKFSRNQNIYPSYSIQAETYCWMLETLGFDTGELFYAILVADPLNKGNNQLRQNVLGFLLKKEFKESFCFLDDASIYCKKFNRNIAENNLNWAIDFWKNQRKATLTQNIKKCAVCEYQTHCLDTQQKTAIK